MVKTKSAYEIKALPATYAGIKFRSRLEARWAYYFDLICLPWTYEPDGYALKAGNYCPDFKCYDFFVEIKPTEGEMEAVTEKLAELSKVTGADVFCLVGEPTHLPQSRWMGGMEADKGRFCYYAFQCKDWEYPDLSGTWEEGLDRPFSEMARRLQFNRGGIAEVDWEVLQARNQVIRQRRDIIKGIPADTYFARYRSEIQPLDKRIASLDKMVFQPKYSWAAA